MARTRVQNEALAQALADFFRGLLHRLVGETSLPDAERSARIDYALTHLDRTELWDLYMQERSLRSNALQPFYNSWRAEHPDPTVSSPMLAEIPGQAQRLFRLHAFLARCCIVPASTLKGRSWFFIQSYVDEGIEHAAYVLAPDDPARRATLIEHWSTSIPNPGNLDTRHEGRYATSNVR